MSVDIYVCICFCVTLLACNAGLNNLRCIAFCIEVSIVFHNKLVETSTATTQGTRIMLWWGKNTCIRMLQHKMAGRDGQEDMTCLWYAKLQNVAANWSNAWDIYKQEELDQVIFLMAVALCFHGRACILLSCTLIGWVHNLGLWLFYTVMLHFSFLTPPFFSETSLHLLSLLLLLFCLSYLLLLIFLSFKCWSASFISTSLYYSFWLVFWGEGYDGVMVEEQVPLAHWRTAFKYRNSGRVFF